MREREEREGERDIDFNAAVNEVEHDAPEPPEDVLNVTPITLESSFIGLEQGLRLHVDFADEEVDVSTTSPSLCHTLCCSI